MDESLFLLFCYLHDVSDRGELFDLWWFCNELQTLYILLWRAITTYAFFCVQSSWRMGSFRSRLEPYPGMIWFDQDWSFFRTLVWLGTLSKNEKVEFILRSGAQPGVRVPPRVREPSQVLRQIIISWRITLKYLMKQFKNANYGISEFYFFCMGVRDQKKVGNRWFKAISVILDLNIRSQKVKYRWPS